MFNFTRSNGGKQTRGLASKLAIAAALVGTTALGAVALEAPAEAARDRAPKPSYSEGFLAVYAPINDKVKGDAPDFEAIKAEVPALIASLENDDDKNAGGGLIYNIGAQSNSPDIQRQGMELMLNSGKVAPEKMAQYTYIAGQLAYSADDFPVARERLSQAIAAGMTDKNLEAVISETYFGEDKYDEGLTYLYDVLMAKGAAGEDLPEAWVKRGVAMAYNNDLSAQAGKFSTLYVSHYPSVNSWGDAIAIQRNFNDYGGNEIVDLMRLSDRTNSLRNERDYVDYIEAADPRRLPGEVKRVIDQGVASGALSGSSVYIAEARGIANGRVRADKADLPAAERDARASGARAIAATAAGDAYLAYEMGDKAAAMYKIALTKPDVDKPRVLTRLGIAQADMGDYDAALASFTAVQGPRAQIAELWKVYAQSKLESSSVEAVSDVVADAATDAATDAAAD